MDLNHPAIQKRAWQFNDDCLLVCLGSSVNAEHVSPLGCPTKFFVDPNNYIDFIRNLQIKHVLCLLAVDLDEYHLSLLDQLPHVHSIYLLHSERPTVAHGKIRGVHNDLSSLIEVMQRNLHAEVLIDSMFMYYQLLKEMLVEKDYDACAKQALIEHCRSVYASDDRVLRDIDEFEREYDRQRAICWYTRDCFVSRMLDRSFRAKDLEVINKFGFFIKDLHEQLELQRFTLPSENFLVYREQR